MLMSDPHQQRKQGTDTKALLSLELWRCSWKWATEACRQAIQPLSQTHQSLGMEAVGEGDPPQQWFG